MTQPDGKPEGFQIKRMAMNGTNGTDEKIRRDAGLNQERDGVKMMLSQGYGTGRSFVERRRQRGQRRESRSCVLCCL